jgi:hypothetical protein
MRWPARRLRAIRFPPTLLKVMHGPIEGVPVSWILWTPSCHELRGQIDAADCQPVFAIRNFDALM